MTGRGLFQPQPFCDSVMSRSITESLQLQSIAFGSMSITRVLSCLIFKNGRVGKGHISKVCTTGTAEETDYLQEQPAPRSWLLFGKDKYSVTTKIRFP